MRIRMCVSSMDEYEQSGTMRCVWFVVVMSSIEESCEASNRA